MTNETLGIGIMENKKMSQKTKDKLKLIPRVKKKCFICGSLKSSVNQVEKCFECGKNFCFDHLWGGQIKKGMKDNEEIRSVCEKCKDTHIYTNL